MLFIGESYILVTGINVALLVLNIKFTKKKGFLIQIFQFQILFAM